jgi:hypothetical protein
LSVGTLPSALMRWILPRGFDRSCASVALKAGREVDLAVVAEVHRSPVVLGVRGLRILVEDDLAAGDRPVERAVGGEAG